MPVRTRETSFIVPSTTTGASDGGVLGHHPHGLVRVVVGPCRSEDVATDACGGVGDQGHAVDAPAQERIPWLRSRRGVRTIRVREPDNRPPETGPPPCRHRFARPGALPGPRRLRSALPIHSSMVCFESGYIPAPSCRGRQDASTPQSVRGRQATPARPGAGRSSSRTRSRRRSDYPQAVRMVLRAPRMM